MKDVILSFIEPGDKFNVNTKEYIINSSKDLTNGYEYYEVSGPIANTGVFSGYNQVKEFIMYNLVDNYGVNEITSYCYDNNGKGAELVFRKTEDTKGYWGYKNGNQDGYSAINVFMDINPIIVTIKAAPVVYIVKNGDILWKIAKNFGTTVDEIAKLNNLKNPNIIKPNQRLLIPVQ
jgi:nucleoid-associated protein YgaU